MESSLVIAQRAAIQEARARYERGEITVEQLTDALNLIAEAQDARSARAIVAGLPRAPYAALAAFDSGAPVPQPTGAPGSARTRGIARIASFMGKARRAGKPWTLAAQSRVSAFMGETIVDLRQAKLPPHGVMRVNVVMGETRIIIPESVRVFARTRVIMGEAHVLGLVGSGEEEYEPPSGEASATLEIFASVTMGTLKIFMANAIEYSIGEIAREILKEALTGVHTHLTQGAARHAAQRAAPDGDD